MVVLKKGIFVQLTIKIPPKKGSFGQYTQKTVIVFNNYHRFFLFFMKLILICNYLELKTAVLYLFLHKKRRLCKCAQTALKIWN